jgi:hypothetical protein
MNFSNSYIESISVHLIGNKLNQQEIILSEKPLNINQELLMRLREYFLGRFSSVFEKYRFFHQSSLKYNEVYNYSKETFSDNSTFHETSINIAKHLYEQSIHPRVKSGELCVCLIKNYIVDNKTFDAIGIFKSENKNGFFEVDNLNRQFNIEYKEGIDINKVDKGCLILNTELKEGFQVFIIDNQNRGEEAQYWRDNFLGLNQISNEFHQTNQFLGIAKNFVTKQLDEEFEVTKADKIDLLNRSVEYFKTHETFDKKEFEEEVFQDSGIIKSFHNFDNTYRQENEIDITDSFDISPQAVKKQARVFKSVLKLDKNFDIYIHGNRGLIEQGVDIDGRKYYKIYYELEH